MADYQEGHTLTNKETGDRVQLQKGPDGSLQWVSIGPTVATDITRTTIPGLIRGAVNMSTAPAGALNLAKRGIAGATDWMGFHDTADRMRADIDRGGFKIPGTELKVNPASGFGFMVDPESAMAQTEKVTGTLYRPQTTAGKFWNAGVEAVPSMWGGGAGLANKAKSVVKGLSSAEGSEAAGQYAQGVLPGMYEGQTPSKYEGLYRTVGALFGGKVPSLARRVVTPFPGDPAHVARAQNVESQIGPIGAGQYTGNSALNGIENYWRQRVPQFSDETQAANVSRALMRSTGGPNVMPTVPVVARQQQSLNRELNSILSDPRAPRVRVDPQMRSDFNDAVMSYRMATGRPIFGGAHGLGPTPLDPFVDRLINARSSGGHPTTGHLPGFAFDQANEARALSRGAPNAERNAYGAFANALDSALERSIPAISTNRRQAENANTLMNTVNRTDPNSSIGIADPAHFSATHPLPSSPTANFARDATAVLKRPSTLNQIGSHAGAGAMSSLLGMGLGMYLHKHGYAPGLGLPDAPITGLIAGPAAHIVGAYGPGMSHMMMSGPVQSYFRNQRILPSRETRSEKLGRLGRVLGSSTDFREATDQAP